MYCGELTDWNSIILQRSPSRNVRTKSYTVPILVWLHIFLSDYWLYVSSEHSSLMGFTFVFRKKKNMVNLVTSWNSKDSQSRERFKWAVLECKRIGLPWWLSGKESAFQFRRHGCREPAWGIPPLTRSCGRALMARLIRPQVFPLECPEHPPPKK